MPPLFTAYSFTDWSARTGPGSPAPRRDALWVGMLRRGGRPAARCCRTRAEATALVRAFLLESVEGGGRALCGFDFSYGYASGFAAAAGLGRPAWRATWDAIAARLKDGDDNHSNRFAVAAELNRRVSGGPGPFWGGPPSARAATLASTSPPFPFLLRRGGALARWRECEARLPGTQEAWKLFGAGSVGSQALTGIPRVRALRDDPALAAVSAVWPYETSFTSDFAARVVHAEVWPGIVRERSARRQEPIPDQAQVLALCEWAAEEDGRGRLARWFERPPDMDDALVARCVEEEGWVLGAAGLPEAGQGRRAAVLSRGAQT